MQQYILFCIYKYIYIQILHTLQHYSFFIFIVDGSQLQSNNHIQQSNKQALNIMIIYLILLQVHIQSIIYINVYHSTHICFIDQYSTIQYIDLYSIFLSHTQHTPAANYMHYILYSLLEIGKISKSLPLEKIINGLFSHQQLPRGNSDAYLLLNTTKLMYQRFFHSPYELWHIGTSQSQNYQNGKQKLDINVTNCPTHVIYQWKALSICQVCRVVVTGNNQLCLCYSRKTDISGKCPYMEVGVSMKQ